MHLPSHIAVLRQYILVFSHTCSATPVFSHTCPAVPRSRTHLSCYTCIFTLILLHLPFLTCPTTPVFPHACPATHSCTTPHLPHLSCTTPLHPHLFAPFWHLQTRTWVVKTYTDWIPLRLYYWCAWQRFTERAGAVFTPFYCPRNWPSKYIYNFVYHRP